MFRTAGFAIAIGLTAAATLAAASPLISGLAIARDGDSLRIGRDEIRLFGIDAPEWEQTCTRDGKSWPCGEAAAQELGRLVTGRELSCIAIDKDEHGRAVARCNLLGKDINAAMVESGHAIAYRHYSTNYVAAEERAKAAKRGIWAGSFTEPREYRLAQRGPDKTPPPRRSSRRGQDVAFAQASGACAIKGNQGSNGWIYHLPGMPYYDRTNAEQMFCSEAEARAAGYRRAIVR